MPSSAADRKVLANRASMDSSSSPARRALASHRCNSRRSGLDSRSGVAPYRQLIHQVRHALRLGLLHEDRNRHLEVQK